MQPPQQWNLARVPALLQQEFPSQRAAALWGSIERRGYLRTLAPWTLALAVISAFFTRLSGLRAILARPGGALGITSLSTLSGALANPRFLRFVRAVTAALEEEDDWGALGERDFVAVDTTWLSLPLTQRWRGLRKIAGDAVGIGAMFALRLRGGRFPLRLLGVLHGAANDTEPVRFFRLLACGPTYLLDRGFYSMKTVAHWIDGGVRFIVRAKTANLLYRVERTVGRPRRWSGLDILEDAVVLLGSEKTRLKRSRVRLVRARRRSDGELIVLVSGHLGWSADELLAAYKQRWEIEDFFFFVKEQLGMAHLYGFSACAMESLLRLAMIGVGLLLRGEGTADADGKTVAQRLRKALAMAKRMLGVPTPWKPNTTRGWRARKRNKKQSPRRELTMTA
jgi:hypothetical protein